MPHWDGQERRQREGHDAYERLIISHFDERFDSLDKKLDSAFPGGDLDAHRRAHEAQIANANDKASLWKAVREKTVSGGVWAAILLLCAAAWEYLKIRVRQ